jgi:hypothetical protein
MTKIAMKKRCKQNSAQANQVVRSNPKVVELSMEYGGVQDHHGPHGANESTEDGGLGLKFLSEFAHGLWFFLEIDNSILG